MQLCTFGHILNSLLVAQVCCIIGIAGSGVNANERTIQALYDSLISAILDIISRLDLSSSNELAQEDADALDEVLSMS